MRRAHQGYRIVWRWIVAAALLTLISGASGSIAGEHTITIARSDCDSLVEHVPAPDVEYQPGIDVDGHPVVPADLDGGRHVKLPDFVLIDITRDIVEQFGLSPDSPLFGAEAFIGVVDIDLRDGRVRFNGADLGDPDVRALMALCRTAESGR
jgi:hypothetical protein